MDKKLFQRLKYRVTQMAPAIFADNMMMFLMKIYDTPWIPTFSNKEIHEVFYYTTGLHHVLDIIDDILIPYYDIHFNFSKMWHVNEEALYKLLYDIKKEFFKKSDEDAKTYFLFYCTMMINFAYAYYIKGVKSALTIVFFEVYFLACYYSKLINFKSDLISISFEASKVSLFCSNIHISHYMMIDKIKIF